MYLKAKKRRSYGLVEELLKYGGSGVMWLEEVVPKEWREGLIVNNKEEPGNYTEALHY